MLEPVNALGLLGWRRAELALVGRQRDRGAVGRRGEAASDAAFVGKLELPGLRLGDRAVADDGEREGGEQGQCAERAFSAALDRHGDEDKRGEDENLADLANGRGKAEDQAAQSDHPHRRVRPPQQHYQAGHGESLEPQVRHDRLLDLDLISVEQDRGDGERAEPARYAPAEQQGIDGDRDRQPG